MQSRFRLIDARESLARPNGRVTLSTLALSLMDCTSALLGDALNAAQVLAS